MAFFVDANVIVYAATSGPYHEPCVEILRAISEDRRRTNVDRRDRGGVARRALGRAGDISGLAVNAHTLFARCSPSITRSSL